MAGPTFGQPRTLRLLANRCGALCWRTNYYAGALITRCNVKILWMWGKCTKRWKTVIVCTTPYHKIYLAKLSCDCRLHSVIIHAALSPVPGENLPLWIAKYVLTEFSEQRRSNRYEPYRLEDALGSSTGDVGGSAAVYWSLKKTRI